MTLARLLRENREDGERGKTIEIARNFLRIGLPPEQIAQCVGLSLAEMNALPTATTKTSGVGVHIRCGTATEAK